jgi:hypothetical protein
MRLHYWSKNDQMKGPKLSTAQLALLPSVANGKGASGQRRQIATALNNRNGTILEGTLPNCHPGGIVFEGVYAPAPPLPAQHYKPIPNITYTHCGTVKVGVSYDGHDILDWKAHDVGGVEKCCEACAAHPQCKYALCPTPTYHAGPPTLVHDKPLIQLQLLADFDTLMCLATRVNPGRSRYWSMDRPSQDCFLKSAKPPGPCNHWPMTVSGTPGLGCRPTYNPPPPPPPPPPIVDYEISVDDRLVYSISTVDQASGNRTILDSYDRSIPVPPEASTTSSGCSFKLLLRGSMAELYINNVLSE